MGHDGIREECMRPVLWALVLIGCETSTQWYEHPCGNGDPVSVICIDEADTVWDPPSAPLCADLGVVPGDECPTDGEQCVLEQGYTCLSVVGSSSEAFLTCQQEPFEGEECPQSSRAVKQDIRYVSDAERQHLASEVLDVKLARYRYRDPEQSGERLGYILEDHPAATFSGDGRVDLYAYVSAVVALAQEQQQEIERLRAEVDALKAQPDAARAGGGSP